MSVQPGDQAPGDQAPPADGPMAGRISLRVKLREGLLRLAQEHASTPRLAVAVAVGIVIGVSPWYGFHVWIGLLVGKVFRLNQVAIFIGEQIGLPFIAPIWMAGSLQLGHRLRHGVWLTLPDELTAEVGWSLLGDWVFGSLLIGAGLALVGGLIAYRLLRGIRKDTDTAEPTSEPTSEANPEANPAWTGRSRGTALGYATLFHTVRLLGRRGGYLLLWVILPYYFLFARSVRRASRTYLERRFGPRSVWRRQRDEWRHLHTFARSLIDNLVVMAGRESDFDWRREGYEYIRDAAEAGEGVLLLSAHVGSRALGGRRLGVPVNLVAYENEAEAIRRFLARIDTADRPRVIPVNDGPMAAVSIMKALRRGEVVAMLADRVRTGPTVEVTLLGAPAHLPAGPFTVAVLSGAPVIVTFGAKVGPRTQSFYARPPLRPGPVPRTERTAAIQNLAQTYADELTHFLQNHPYQWFNFYDFWK